ncbi:MAG: mechanosensitive ion channel family protein, partial [Planctomycetaceae bacterium]
MMIEKFGQILALIPQAAVPDPDSAGTALSAQSPDLLQQVREAVTADLSREMLVRVLTHWLPAIAAAAAVFLFGRILVRLAVRMIEQASRRARMDETLAKFLGNFASIILQLVVCIASLSCLGIDTTSLSAVLVASGFAIGMALQGSLGNVASGVLLVLFRPFRVGDTIEVAGMIGRVVEIQIFNTILLSPD